MKLLHLASEYPPARIFGLGRYVHDLARAQVRTGQEVHVITNSLSGKEHEAEKNGVRIYRIHFPSPPKPPDGATQVVQFNHLMYERALEILPNLQGTDVVVAHDWLSILAADMIRRLLGCRLVLTIHDTVIGKTFGKLSNEDKFVAQLEKWGCQIADDVIAVSEHVASELTGVYEADPAKVHVVPGGVAPEWFQTVDPQFLPDLKSAIAEPDDFLISYVGRIDKEKGVDVLLTAFAGLAKENHKLKLVLAGKGSEETKLLRIAREQQIESRVKFLGYVAGPALEALYKVSDLLVCPSTYEPFGIVPLEGMINRIPVIASDTGGMAKIVVDQESGLKVKPGDAGALYHAMKRIIENPKLAGSLAEGGYKRASQVYSWDRVAELADPIYSGAVNSRPRTRMGPGIRVSPGRQKLTAGLRVKDAERFADECLADLSEYCDEIVVVDDGSTDKTLEILAKYSKITQVVRWQKSFFHEGIDRNVVLALAKNTDPDWILLPDIDEVFESRFKSELPGMLAQDEVALYAFLFCHFWRSRTHYRVDGKWGKETESFPIPRLVRNQPSLFYPVDKALGTAQIRGVQGKAVVSDIRVKHYGHLYEDLSKQKVQVYSKLDPNSDYSYMVDETDLELAEWIEELPVLVEAKT